MAEPQLRYSVEKDHTEATVEDVVERSKSRTSHQDLTRYGSDPETMAAYEEILSWDEETRRKKERALVRILDARIALPMVLLYLLNYLDRNSIAQARITGLVKYTHITENDYALVNGIFYISYILAQIPSNLILTRVRPSLFMCTIVVLWAIISSCTAVCRSLGQLIAVRFILGIVEGPFFPGASYLLTCWYTRKEIGQRYSIFISGICLSNAVGGLISAGITSNMNGKKGIQGWQWLFIIEGSITVFVALVLLFVVPDYPHTTKSLSAQNRVLSQLRLDQDIGLPDTDDVSMKEGVRLCLKDYRSWLIAGIQFCIVTMIGFNWFYPSLVQGLGYKNQTTILLLTVPPYVLAFLFSYAMAWNADRTQRRALHWQIAFLITGISLVLLTALAKKNYPGPKYFVTFILACGSFTAYTVAYPWVASIMPRPATKRATLIALGNMFANLGAFLNSYIFYAALGPHYQVSWGIVLGLTVCGSVGVAYMSYRVKQRNKELDVIEEEYKSGQISEAQLRTMDPDAQLAATTGFRLVR